MNAPELYFHLKKVLEKNGIESPQFEAMCIIEHIFSQKLAHILLDKSEASTEQISLADSITYRRIDGEPLQYLLGKWEFYGMPFYVGEGVLIPRQDTETLVETVIKAAASFNFPKIIDLCSGSGCIACAISANVRGAKVYALENSPKAIEWLKKNIVLNKSAISIVCADVLDEKAVINNADIIVCNPPYLTQEDMNNLQKEVTFEPQEALFGGTDGLDFYRKITRIWKKSLNASGILAYEIGLGQEKDVQEILLENGFVNIEFIRDLPGIIRVVKGEMPI